MTKDLSTQNSEAYIAYQSLKPTKIIDKVEVISSLEIFWTYLDNLCRSISKNTPKNGFIYQWIFNAEFKEKDLDKYCKANIFAAKDSLKRIIKICQQQEISNVLRRVLIDFICDLKIFIEFFDKSQNYKWLLGNTNSHISNFYYDLAQNIFYNGKPGKHEEEYLTLSSSTPFIIRQSIEYKIKRILGIDYIEISGKPHKTLANVYFRALKNNKSFYKTRKFDFETIELIHSWTHFFIHGGYRARPWAIESALAYLNEFFYSGITSQKTSLSLYAGIEIFESDLSEIIQRTQNFLKKEISQDANIIWLSRPELAYMKNHEQ